MTSQLSDQKIDNAQAYMDAVAEVARVAGDVANSYFGKNPETRTKADGSPVSVADVSAERAAREWIERRFPVDGILGEELPVARPDAERRWIEESRRVVHDVRLQIDAGHEEAGGQCQRSKNDRRRPARGWRRN